MTTTFEPVIEFDVGQSDFYFESLVAQFPEAHRDHVESLAVGDTTSMVCYVPVEDMSDFSFDSVVSLRMCQPVTD